MAQQGLNITAKSNCNPKWAQSTAARTASFCFVTKAQLCADAFFCCFQNLSAQLADGKQRSACTHVEWELLLTPQRNEQCQCADVFCCAGRYVNGTWLYTCPPASMWYSDTPILASHVYLDMDFIEIRILLSYSLSLCFPSSQDLGHSATLY